MIMRGRIPGTLLACALAVASAVSTAPVAHAATWTVSPAGSLAATSSTFVLANTSNGAAIRCQSTVLNGTVPAAGSGLSGNSIAQFTGGTFTGCIGGPFGLTCTVTVIGPWLLNAVSYNGAGVTTGTLANVRIIVTCGSCSFTLAGSLAFTYDNNTGVLRIFGNLAVTSASFGCLGAFRAGDLVRVDVSYSVSPRPVLTSP